MPGNWSTSSHSRRNLSIGEMHVLNVLRFVVNPVVAKDSSIDRGTVSEQALARLTRRGLVEVIDEDDERYVKLTDLGVDFLTETFPNDG